MTQAAMNCWEALELLEGLGAGAITADDPLAKDAQRHLSSCGACQAALPGRLAWNANLTTAMTAMDVPSDLESRLAKQLTMTAAPATVAAAPRTRRRTWLIGLVTLAAAVLLLVVWQQPWTQREELLSLRTIETNIGCELTELKKVNDLPPLNWHPELPESWRVFFELSPHLLYAFPSEQPRSPAVLVPFEFRHASLGNPIRGRLIMIPVSQFRDPPTATDFSVAPVNYFNGFGWCGWTEGGVVYLCYVRSVGGGEMHLFQQLLRESRNFT